MNSNANHFLTADEFSSLKEVSIEVMQKQIPFEHRTRLIEMGLIEQKIGALIVTLEGQMRILKGK